MFVLIGVLLWFLFLACFLVQTGPRGVQRPKPSLNPGLKNNHKSAQGPIKHPFPIYHGTTTGAAVCSHSHTHTRIHQQHVIMATTIAKPRTERVDSQDPGRKMILLSVNVVREAVREVADTFWEWLALCPCWVIAIIIRIATTWAEHFSADAFQKQDDQKDRDGYLTGNTSLTGRFC